MSTFFHGIQNKIANLAAWALAQFGPIAAERYRRATGRADVPQHIQEQLIRAAQAKRERKAYKRRENHVGCVSCNNCLSLEQYLEALDYAH